MRRGAARALCVSAACCIACDAPLQDAREVELVSVLTRADQSLLLTRPALTASKYRLMASDPYAFFRGTFPVYLHDVEAGTVGDARSPHAAAVFPLSIGDAHVENFGTLLGADGTLAFEPNDLDGADRYPYLVEVRRLAIATVLAARLSNPDDEALRASATQAERDAALSFARSYADAIDELASGQARAPVTGGGDSPVLVDLFERAQEDLEQRSELAELTIVDAGRRTLVRGGVDEDDPENVYVDAAALVIEALPAAIERYRAGLESPPSSEFFALKDVAREFGSGVASRTRVRFILLIEGPTPELEDDVLLEMKEIGDSGARPATFEGVSAATIEERVLRARETCWSSRAAEPLWGMTWLLGLPMQIKHESEAEKTLRVRRLEEELGTPEAIAALGADLGRQLATIHAGSDALDPGLVQAIADAIGDDHQAFANEQADVAITYADQVLADHARFVHALDALGPTLGVVPGEADALSADAAALIGTPPAAVH